MVIVKLEVAYRRPIRYDDVVEVRTRVTGTSRVKIEHEYSIRVVEHDGQPADEDAAIAFTTLACVGKDGRPQALPDLLSGHPRGE